jgi:phosphatidylserine/phosphatidylglycerophosphate/cardiolipin synthase-like enzyme
MSSRYLKGFPIPILQVPLGEKEDEELLYYSIDQARKCIYLTTAYFAPSRRMLHVLETAESRG